MKTYAICGISTRAIAQFIMPLVGKPNLPLLGNFTKYGKVVAILDADPERVKAFNSKQGTNFPFYSPDEFDKMIAETNPDVVVVTCIDVMHSEYIVKGLQHDRDVITEKPMVINGRQARAVIDAEKKSKGCVRVAFNYRYTPAHKQIKRMVLDGMLGKITNVEFNYLLDTYHGSSYFARWNRNRELSGGLTVTKACHHFDLVNWWLGDFPESVFAFGARNYYGSGSPTDPNPENGSPLPVTEQKAACPYWQRWNARNMQAPQDDHLNVYEAAYSLPTKLQYPKPLYFYDKEIGIEDTYSAVVRYRNGASMSYSLNASAPWEGYILAINGTKGRLETTHYTAPSRCPFPAPEHQTITYLPLFGERQIWETRQVEGGHGGADQVMKWDMFVEPSKESEELNIYAGAEAGAYSVAVGEAVWRSAVEKKPIEIEDLLG